MKKVVSNVIILSLLLNSFQLLAMNIQMSESEEYRDGLHCLAKVENQQEIALKDLPDEIISCEILSYCDAQTLRSFKIIERHDRVMLDKYIASIEIEHYMIGDNATGFVWNYAEIKKLMQRLKEKVKQYDFINLPFLNSNRTMTRKKIEFLMYKDVQDALFDFFSSGQGAIVSPIILSRLKCIKDVLCCYPCAKRCVLSKKFTCLLRLRHALWVLPIIFTPIILICSICAMLALYFFGITPVWCIIIPWIFLLGFLGFPLYCVCMNYVRHAQRRLMQNRRAERVAGDYDIMRLRRTIYERGKKSVCPECLLKLDEECLEKNLCGHAFHKGCVQNRNFCSFCREDLTGDRAYAIVRRHGMPNVLGFMRDLNG